MWFKSDLEYGIQKDDSWFARFRRVAFGVLAPVLNQVCLHHGKKKSPLKPEWQLNYLQAAPTIGAMSIAEISKLQAFPVADFTLEQWRDHLKKAPGNIFKRLKLDREATLATSDPTDVPFSWDKEVPKQITKEAADDEIMVEEELKGIVLATAENDTTIPVTLVFHNLCDTVDD
jgi:hypothetical protein